MKFFFSSSFVVSPPTVLTVTGLGQQGSAASVKVYSSIAMYDRVLFIWVVCIQHHGSCK